MKLIEGFIYSLIVFVGLYAIVAVAMRVFDLSSVFYAHVSGGIVGTIAGVSVFIFFLVKKK